MKNSTRRMCLEDLKAHPLQSQIYTPCSPVDEEALADSLRRHGQRDPIVVMPVDNKAGLPAFAILDGHRRVAAMITNGETEANVLVRDDLKHADASTVTEEFIGYNVNRRQLHPLDKARAVQHLFMAKENCPVQHLNVWKREELRDRIGKTLNMSGRNLDRYLRILETPLPIQTAVRDGRLRLVPASKVAFMPSEKQKELAARIAVLPPGTNVTELVEEYVGASASRNRRAVGYDVRSLAVHLKTGVSALSDRLDELDLEQVRKCLPYLRGGQELIRKIIRKAS